MTSDAALRAALHRAAESIDRALTYLDLPDGISQVCQPTARPQGNGETKTQWCWHHEQPYGSCADGDASCRPEDVSDLTRSDPTGESALRRNGSQGKRKVLSSYVEGIARNAENLLRFTIAGQPERMTEAEQRKIDQLAAANQQHCDSHLRARTPEGDPVEVEPRGGPTDLGGILDYKRLLCPDCIARTKWKHSEGIRPAYPSQSEVQHFTTHKRWPMAHALA